MTATIEKLNDMRQQLKMENTSLEAEKMGLINDIKLHRERRRNTIKEIENLEEEKKKVAKSYNGVKEKVEIELAKIADREETLKFETAESLKVIKKEKDIVMALKADCDKAIKQNEKKIAFAKSQLKQSLISALKSLNTLSVDNKNSMGVLQAISEGL